MAGGVQFDDEPGAGVSTAPYMTQRIAVVPGGPAGFAGWLVKKGYAKDGVKAERILLAIVAVLIVITFAVPLLLIHKAKGPSPEQLQIYINRMGAERP